MSIAVLMCTYNGMPFLPDQIGTIERQTVADRHLWISDDGSTDGTCEEIEAQVGRANGWIHALEGPRQGFAENFRSLVCRREIDADYFAFSDQDDIWDADKLRVAMDALAELGSELPALYCSRTRIVDAEGNAIGMSPLFKRTPSFRNALVQSLAGGNTMVINRAARELLAEAGQDVRFIAHDWWAYLIISGCGGRVIYDRNPHIGYRQHGGNAIGENGSWRARLQRLQFVMSTGYRGWIDTHLDCLRPIEHRLTPEAREARDAFRQARKRTGLPAIKLLRRSGVYRQTGLGQVSLMAAIGCGLL